MATNTIYWYGKNIIQDASNRLVTDSEKNTWNGKANKDHSHTISDITNLQTTLDGKAASNHTHTASQITTLDTYLSNYKFTTKNISDFPNSLKNPESLTITLGGGAIKGYNTFTYDGSSSYTIDITASAIKAVPISGGTMTGNLLFENSSCTIGSSLTTATTNPTIYATDVISKDLHIKQQGEPVASIIRSYTSNILVPTLRFNVGGDANKYVDITPDETLSKDISLKLPISSGTLALASDLNKYYAMQSYITIYRDYVDVARQAMPTYHTRLCGDGIYGYQDSSTIVARITGMNSGEISISGDSGVGIAAGVDGKIDLSNTTASISGGHYTFSLNPGDITVTSDYSGNTFEDEVIFDYGQYGNIDLYKGKNINLYDLNGKKHFTMQAVPNGLNANTPNGYPNLKIKGSDWIATTQYNTNFFNPLLNIIGNNTEICAILRYDGSLADDIKGVGLKVCADITDKTIQIYYMHYKSLGSTISKPFIYVDYTENSSYGYVPIFRATRFTGAFVNTSCNTAVQVGSSSFEPLGGTGYSSDVSIGRNSNKWSYVYATNGTIQTSNELKKNIIKDGIDSRYEQLYKKLEPIAFTWNNETADGSNHDRIHLGLGAQTTKKHMDEVGITAEEYALYCEDTLLDEDGNETGEKEYGINYGQLHALHIHMIQKLLKEIDDLKAELKALKEK